MGFVPKIAYRLRGVVRRRGLTVGRGVRLGARVTVSGRVTLGNRAAVYRHSDLTGPIVIGDDSFINRSAYIRPQVTIGSRVAIGPYVRIITDSHEIGGPEQRAGKSTVSPIRIGDGAWIGASVTLIGPVTVGEGAVVGAGSLVLSDVPPNTTVAGVPARHIRDL